MNKPYWATQMDGRREGETDRRMDGQRGTDRQRPQEQMGDGQPTSTRLTIKDGSMHGILNNAIQHFLLLK